VFGYSESVGKSRHVVGVIRSVDKATVGRSIEEKSGRLFFTAPPSTKRAFANMPIPAHSSNLGSDKVERPL
jgi:hypothetical protein